MSAVEEITELMMAGHSIDYACEKGAVGGGWRRQDVLGVVDRAGWELDGSGRIPFHLRRGPASRGRGGRVRTRPPVGRVPVPSLPRPLESIAQWVETEGATVGAPRQNGRATMPTGPAIAPMHPTPDVAPEPSPEEPALVVRQEPVGESYHLGWRDRCAADCPGCSAPDVEPAPSSVVEKEDTSPPPGGSDDYITLDEVLACAPASAAVLEQLAATQTPTNESGAALITAAETAPAPAGHGNAGPDAQPQVSPSRTHLGEDGGPGASDAPAAPPVAPIDLLAVGLAHPDPAVQAKARRAQAAVDALCTALLWSGGPRG